MDDEPNSLETKRVPFQATRTAVTTFQARLASTLLLYQGFSELTVPKFQDHVLPPLVNVANAFSG